MAALAVAQAITASPMVAPARVSSSPVASIISVPRHHGGEQNVAYQAVTPRTPAALTPQPVTQALIPVGRTAIRVPILMYHYIRVNPDPGDKMGFGLSVTPADFNAQLDWLQANGYHAVDFNDLRAYYAGSRPLPAKPVILTFDDGYRDLYTDAYPALLKRNMKGVAYLVSGFLGAPNNVTRDQVREMDLNGIQIGAHTYSHIDLTKASDAEVHKQLFDSKADLEQLVGHPVLDFCYPAGQFNAKVAAAVQGAGYADATTTQDGTIHTFGDRFTWSRVRISGGETLARFASDLSATEPSVTTDTISSLADIRALPGLRLPLIYPAAPQLPPPGIAGRTLLP